MQLAVGSIFMNSEEYLPRYFSQMAALRETVRPLGWRLRLILVEGDSTDRTWDKLHSLSAGFDAMIIKRNHNGLPYKSVDNPRRWTQVSYASNGVLEAVADEDDIFIWVESDLIWDAGLMCDLIRHVERGTAAVSPLCIGPDKLFYDTWGFRKDGQRFQKQEPYHPAVNGEMTEIDSAGSCIVMRGDIAASCRFDPPELGIVGFCGRIREAGNKMYVDPILWVNHP